MLNLVVRRETARLLKVKSMKNTNDRIGNQTCDLLVCSTVPQPTVLPHTPLVYMPSLFVFRSYLETLGLMLRLGYGADNQIPCTYLRVNFLINPLHMEERKECVSSPKEQH
jgi:hypothetical protein